RRGARGGGSGSGSAARRPGGSRASGPRRWCDSCAGRTVRARSRRQSSCAGLPHPTLLPALSAFSPARGVDATLAGQATLVNDARPADADVADDEAGRLRDLLADELATTYGIAPNTKWGVARCSGD